jgi:RsiW-degrading membrane proteinase PrsW (M82 family)
LARTTRLSGLTGLLAWLLLPAALLLTWLTRLRVVLLLLILIGVLVLLVHFLLLGGLHPTKHNVSPLEFVPDRTRPLED